MSPTMQIAPDLDVNKSRQTLKMRRSLARTGGSIASFPPDSITATSRFRFSVHTAAVADPASSSAAIAARLMRQFLCLSALQ